MKIKLETLYRSYNTLKSLADQPIDLDVLLKLRNLLIQLQEPFQTLKTTQESILEEVGAKLAESPTGEIQYDLSDEQYKEFLERLYPHLQDEVDIQWNPISAKDLEGAILSIKDLESVQFLFHDLENATKEALQE